jgi:hypothetical protein
VRALARRAELERGLATGGEVRRPTGRRARGGMNNTGHNTPTMRRARRLVPQGTPVPRRTRSGWNAGLLVEAQATATTTTSTQTDGRKTGVVSAPSRRTQTLGWWCCGRAYMLQRARP